jgi:uncharacterized membrane protein
MSEYSSPSRESARRVGQHLKRSWQNFLDHWQEWLGPMLIAAAIVITALLCCLFPHWLVVGPITCGLYACALEAIRNRPVHAGQLRRGWERLGSSLAASWFIGTVSFLPALLLGGAFIALLAVLVNMLPPERSRRAVADRGDVMIRAATGEPQPAVPNEAGSPAARHAAESDQPAVERNRDEPEPFEILLVTLLMLTFYGGLFLGIILLFLWQLWFSTRMMFVFPLIADRGTRFIPAIRESWVQTRCRFWELLAVNLVAGIVTMLGAYVMYVGLIVTVPLGLTILVSVYEERYGAKYYGESATDDPTGP